MRAAPRGFTLLELLVVLAIMAIAVAGAALAFRDPDRQALLRDAQRLEALLESGRAWSRSSGQPLTWQPTADGFRFTGRQPPQPAQRWLNEGVQVQWPQGTARELMLGPEPIIAAQSVVLQLRNERVRVATDGLHPFAVGSP